MDKTTFTILLVDDMMVNIKIPNRFFMNGSSEKITEILEILKKIPEYKNVNEIKSEMYYDSSIESKTASVDAIERIKTHETHHIDLIISDLNMSPKDGCDVVKEASKFNIPIYMTSDSLSTFFKDENNSCKTIQNAENELVRGFNDCCNLPNVFGIHKCGKLSIPDIKSLFDKFVEYKLKGQTRETLDGSLNELIGDVNLNKPIQNNSELKRTPSLLLKADPNLIPVIPKDSWITRMKTIFSNSPKKVIPVNTGGNNKKNKNKNTKKNNTKKKNTKKNNTKKSTRK